MTTANTHVLVRHEDLTVFVETVLAKKGVNPNHARMLADALVWADMRDVGSHGVYRLPRYVQFMDSGLMNPAAKVEVKLKLPAALVLEADKAPGAIAMMHATRLACEQAKHAGLCYAVARHTTHTGAIGYFANWAAERGMAAIVASAGSPNMAYFGARVPSLSTSPIAIAVPAGDGKVIALDMSTAILGIGRLAQAKERGEPLPPGAALDSQGDPTTDPSKGTIPLPLGGAKGSGLALMLECLLGVLSGAPVLTRMIGPGGKIGHSHNGVVIALDIEQFRSIGDFESDVAESAAAIKELPRQDGYDELLLPGERGSRAYQKSLTDGTRISNGTWAALETLSSRLGVSMPQRLGEV